MVPRLGSRPRPSNPFKPAIPRLGTPWFQDWETWAPTLGNAPVPLKGVLPRLGNKGLNVWELVVSQKWNRSNIGTHGFQPSGTHRSGNRSSKVGKCRFSTLGNTQFLEMGMLGSKVQQHGFRPSGPRCSMEWEPKVVGA